jgi:hypothetical protein
LRTSADAASFTIEHTCAGAPQRNDMAHVHSDQFELVRSGLGPPLTRRGLLTMSAGLGALALAAAVGQRPAFAAAQAHAVDALLLNCIDYRLIAHVNNYMNARRLTDDYDQVVLAGASLAAVHPTLPAWNETFWDQLQVSVDLHSIGRVIVLDHRDCGAYKPHLGRDYGQEPEAETQVHAVYLDTLRHQLNARQPQLSVELPLMSLNGSVADMT